MSRHLICSIIIVALAAGINAFEACPAGAAATPTPIIANGDFSSPANNGFYGWITGTTGLNVPDPVTSSARSHVAPPSAQLGYTSDVTIGPYFNDAWIQQSLTLPANCTTANLSFFCSYDCGDTSTVWSQTNIYYQEAKIYTTPVVNPALPGGSMLFHTNTITALGEWWPYNVNLIPLANQPPDKETALQLFFHVRDANLHDGTMMWVDDVSVLCITATPTPTFTITQTSTISPTISPTPSITLTATLSPTFTRSPTITPTATVTPYVVPLGQFQVFPNPVSGSSVNFLYTLEAPSNVYIDIYNLLGYRIAHLEDRNRPARINNQTSWAIHNIAPGVYLARVFLETSDGRRTELARKRVVILGP